VTTNVGTQYGPNEADNPDFDDGTQYLNFDVDEQENVGKVFLIKHLLYLKLSRIPFVYITKSLCFCVCNPLDQCRRTLEMYKTRPKSWRNANIISAASTSIDESFLPKNNGKKFIEDCGFLVRDKLLIKRV